MLREDFIKKNPLRVLNTDINGKAITQRMGLVIARAGLGKTAILVQIALDSLLRGNQVVHISIGQSLDKTRAWYDDIFKDIVQNTRLENAAEIHDEIIRNRLIMTFKESSFSRPKLEERLNDLVYQNIFRPNLLIVDGFDFIDAERQALVELRELMVAMELHVWFSAVSEREDTPECPAGVPAPCEELADLFDTVILLQPSPEQTDISLNIAKDTAGCVEKGRILNLDPATLLIKAV